MILVYFKSALRSIYKRKFFSFINIIGLAIGISASIVIFILVQFDFSFDKKHKDGDRIFRIYSQRGSGSDFSKIPGVPVPLFTAIEHDITGVEMAVPLIRIDFDVKISPTTGNFTTPTKYRKGAKLIYTNSNYFKLFSYDWVAGNPEHALDNSFQTVLTEERAAVYFPNTKAVDIIGKTLVYDDSLLTTISGIVKPLKGNTDFTFKEFVSIATVANSGLRNNYYWEEWNGVNSDVQLFVKLLQGTSSNKISSDLTNLLLNHSDEKAKSEKAALLLQPLSDIHFNPELNPFEERNADRPTLYALLAVALFLLLLGCINFINLSTAQALERTKEIGVRKSVGALKSQLVTQFLVETGILTAMAATVSMSFAPLILRLFKDFIPAKINAALLFTPEVAIFIFILVILLSIVFGIYQTIIWTRIKPAAVLKGQFTFGQNNKGSNSFRRALIVFQFCIAQFFIIATLIVGQQIHFSLSKDLGFKKEAIVFAHFPNNDGNQLKKMLLLQRIKSIPGIGIASLGSTPPSSRATLSRDLKYFNGKNEIETDVEYKYADTNYFNLYQLKVLAGRILRASDSVHEFVINQTYAKGLGFAKPEDAIGKTLYNSFTNEQTPIVGVIADFHTKSTHAAIKPLLFASNTKYNTSIHFSLSHSTDGVAAWQKTLSQVEEKWKDLYPDEPFDYNFMSDSIAAFYKKETDTVTLLQWSSWLAIFISCLGLSGLVIFMVNKRIKEIGVRKVLGASTTQIITLISKDFIKLVVVALFIATPLAWYFMSNWLQEFAYRISMPLWVFAATGMCAVLIAFITIGFQSLKAAMANPVKSIRTE